MNTIVSQFGNPRGVLGSLVGHLMAWNNRDRNLWAVSLLDIQPTDPILEIGFGPGVAIERLATLAPLGHVAGIEISATMLGQASQRNAEAIRRGRVELRLGNVAALPYPDATFTKTFSFNSFQFWPDQAAGLAELYRVLQTGGVIAVAMQPRWAKTNAEVQTIGEGIAQQVEAAGFAHIRLETKAMKPMNAVCILGVKRA